MNNLREAMARALYEHREKPVANADFSRQQALWHDCLLQADAALAAIDAAGFAVAPKHMPSEARDLAAKYYGVSQDIAHDLYDTSVARLNAAPKP